MENYNNQNDEQVGLIEPLTRRRFIQGSSALMAVPFLAANTVASTPENPDIIPTKTINNEGERVVSTCSSFDCGGKCDIRAHVKEGVVTRISTRPDADLDEEMPIMRAWS